MPGMFYEDKGHDRGSGRDKGTGGGAGRGVIAPKKWWRMRTDENKGV